MGGNGWIDGSNVSGSLLLRAISNSWPLIIIRWIGDEERLFRSCVISHLRASSQLLPTNPGQCCLGYFRAYMFREGKEQANN